MDGNKKGNGTSTTKMNSSSQNKKQNGINTKNSFDVLNSENTNGVEIGSDEWMQMRNKIDLACDLGMQIGESEKLRWSKDLKKYYDEKCKAKTKGKLMESLKWRVAKLQKDISYGHTNVAMNAKLKADELCKKIMKETGNTHNQAYLQAYDECYKSELDVIEGWVIEKQTAEVELFFLSDLVLTDMVRNTWTEEMIQQFESLVGLKVDEMIQKSFEEGVNECMNDEVANESNGIASFIAQDMASNVVGSSSAQVQGEIAPNSSLF